MRFDTPDSAYHGSRALADLNEANEIAVDRAVIVSKDSSGAATLAKTHFAMPEGTMGATVAGTLIGTFGGPAGAAVGATAGFLLGSMSDWFRSRISSDFVADVTNRLEPGTAALVAQINEDVPDAVDLRMTELGGVVWRYALEDVTDDETTKESNVIRDKFRAFRKQQFH
ncbi:MAG TPA: DUF1269 domain-containing protein [Vicinamibacterales bacterium]|nr:DUF1269 domain-containing protein [Vicinamibacterales bacterium]